MSTMGSFLGGIVIGLGIIKLGELLWKTVGAFGLIERFRMWRRARYFQRLQINHLRMMLQEDARWMAHDKTAAALTARYLDSLAPDWEFRYYDSARTLRERLGLDPILGGITSTTKPGGEHG